VSIYGAEYDIIETQLLGTTEQENFHPPTAAYLVLPLSYLSPFVSVVTWSILNLILYIGTMWMCLRGLGVDKQRSFCAICFTLLWFPFIHQTGVANLSVILTFLLWRVWFALRAGSEIKAGLFLGCAALLKIFPLIFIPYFLYTRRFRAAMASLSIIVLSLLVIYLLGGIADWNEYVTSRMAENVSRWVTFPAIQSLSSVLATLDMFVLGGTDMMRVEASALICGGLLIHAVVILGLTQSKDRLIAGYAVTLVMMLVSSPIMWTHLYMVLFLPAVLIYLSSPQRNFWNREMFLCSLLLLSLPDIFLGQILFSSFLEQEFKVIITMLTKLPLLGVCLFGVVAVRSLHEKVDVR
jgi:alpha-1,2-mannosyltransferase